MEQRNKTLRQAGRAALYAVFKRRHARTRRLFITFQSLSFTLVILLSVILQTYLQIKPPSYALTPAVKNLVGESRDDAATYLKEDTKAKAFSFSVPKSSDGGGDASVHTGRVADAYEASLAKDAREGISVTEKESQIAIGLTPTFKTYEGRKVEGDHIVYLASGGVKLVYTLKYNGLKEDIIVPDYRGDALDYSFELSLPAGTEARLDSSGNIGIYSSDPTLFGEISFGSDDDRARVEKARENGEKNHLVMTIPYPIVKDASGTEYTDKATFSLGAKQTKTSQAAADPNLPVEVQEKMKASTTKNVYELTIASKGLKGLSYPLSIDPTVTVTSASEFAGVNNEGGVEVDSTNNLIRRSSLTGGVVTWANTTLFLSSARRHPCLFMLNGYIYIVNGRTPTTNVATVEYASIGSDGNVSGSWLTTTSVGFISGACNGNYAATSYNNHLYISSHLSTWYVKQNPNGTLGSWQATSGFSGINNVNFSHQIIANAGFFYVLGGIDAEAGSATRANVSYASINGDGSLGSFANTSSLVSARHAGIVGAHNGYIYYAGGFQNGASGTASVQRASINSDGTLAAWVEQTNVLSSTRYYHAGGGISNGYLYAYGGQNSGGSAPNNTTDYAPIMADGSIGTSRTTSNMPTLLFDGSGSGVVYNGKLYIAGGCSTGIGNCTDANTHLNGIYYATVKPAGEPYGFSNTNNVTTARVGHVVVAYNGYIYSIGGCTALGGTSGSYANCTTATTSVEYGTINANGTVTWNGTTTGINAARWGFAAGANNGYMYVTGGCESGFLGACTRQSNSFWAPINTNGTIGAWTTDGDAFTARSYHGFAAYDGYLYAAGGDEAAGVVNTVYKSAIQTNGSPGAWSTTTAMPVAGLNVTMQAYGGYLYAVNPGANTDVISAPFTTSGSIGSWTNVIDITASGQPEVFIDRGIFYTYNSGGGTSIQYGYLVGDGTITNATGGTSTLTTTTVVSAGPHDHSNAVASYNGFMYVVSGCNNSTGDDCANSPLTTEHTLLNNGGNGVATTVVTTTDGTDWGSGRHGHDSVYLNGYIYISSGRSNDCTIGCTYPTITSIRKGTVAANGTFDNWVTAADVPDGGRVNHQMVAVNGYMFVIAGGNSSLTPQNTVYRASINPTDGSLGSWDTLANFPIQVRDHTANVFGSNIVVTGGFDQTNATLNNAYYASVDASGNLSSWTATTALPGVRRFHAAVGVGNNLYVLGGLDAPNNIIYNDVVVADVAANGALSAWRKVGDLPSGRHAHLAAAANGFMYFGQGCNGTTATAVTTCSANAVDDLWVAAIGSNGALGGWYPAGGGLDGGRIQITSEVINGRLYTLGGCHSGCDATGDVTNRGRFVGLGSIPRIGSLSKKYDFDTGVKPTKLITRGTKRTGTEVGVKYNNNVLCGATAFDQTQSILDTGYSGLNAQTLTLGTSRTLARCINIRYKIDDTLSAVFPDRNNTTTITDFDLYFISNPGQRLRGGRTFTNGVDRGLDAQPNP